MRLAHSAYGRPVCLREGTVQVLAVESPKLFRQMVQELEGLPPGEHGDFVLSKDFTPIPLATHAALIKDILHPDFTQRKIVARILQMLETRAADEQFFVMTREMMGRLEQYLAVLTESVDIPLTFDAEMDLVSLLKAAGVRVAEDAGTVERLCGYMDLLTELNLASFFVFVNLKAYLDTEELKLFYTHIAYRQYRVLLLESSCRKGLRELEHTVLIDADRCEVINDNDT